MLTAKEILQIDATILAGLFILMTVISISNESPTQELQKINNQIESLEILKTNKTDLEKKLNSSLQNSERLSNEMKTLQGDSAETAMLEFNNSVNEYQKTKQDLANIENTLSQENSLLEKWNQTEEKIKQQNAEYSNFFTKIPQIWIYRIGSTFTASAVFAIFMSLYERSSATRPYKVLQYLSISVMGAGFIFLIFMFWTIGSEYQ